MNNIFRFLIALVLAPTVFIAALFLFALALPVILIIQILIAIVITVVIIVGFFAFFYYAVRKEPKVKKTVHTVSYSIKSGKRK